MTLAEGVRESGVELGAFIARTSESAFCVDTLSMHPAGQIRTFVYVWNERYTTLSLFLKSGEELSYKVELLWISIDENRLARISLMRVDFSSMGNRFWIAFKIQCFENFLFNSITMTLIVSISEFTCWLRSPVLSPQKRLFRLLKLSRTQQKLTEAKVVRSRSSFPTQKTQFSFQLAVFL